MAASFVHFWVLREKEKARGERMKIDKMKAGGDGL